jgi:hypothetical protein
MEQMAAIKAKVYHVLPVSVNKKVYSLETVSLGELTGQAHEVVCKSDDRKEIWRTRVYEQLYEPMLETDVQEVYAVDLYLEGDKVVVKLEYREALLVDAISGQLLK